MSWRFRKRVKIIPGIYLNLSQKGISTTIGPRGLSVNLGPNGSYLNAGIPGTGISNRIPLHNTNHHVPAEKAKEIADKLRYLLDQTYDDSTQIRSQDIDHLTSPGLASLKDTIIAAHKEHAELSTILSGKELQKSATDVKLNRLRKSIFKFLYKKRILRLTDESQVLGEELLELVEQQKLATVDLQIHNDETFDALYRNVERAYQLLTSCKRIWDVTSSKEINRIQSRSAASTEVRRAPVRANIEDSELIIIKSVPLKLENKNGGDLYFYPGFVIVHEQKLDFAILDYSEFSVGFEYVQFIESEPVPSDAQVIGQTWHKVNKDGSPDRRFTGNYRIPITKYGQLNFTSPTGLNEQYHVSNAEYAKLFYEALKEYINAVKTAHSLLGEFA
jgi:hypothetical protein